MNYCTKITLAAAMMLAMNVASHAQSGVTDTTAIISMDRCIAIALDQSPTVQIADIEVNRVNYARTETLASLLPSINFGANYNRMLAKQVMYMNTDRFAGMLPGGDGDSDDTTTTQSRAGGGNDTGMKVGLDNSYQVGFSAQLPLVAPQLWTSLKLNDAQILQTVEDARTSRLNLVNSVKNAYYALLLAIDTRATLQQSYDMALFTADLYQKKFSLGAASQYDVLRTQVQVRNVEPEISQADIAIKQAQLQLSILMGLDSSVRFMPDVTLSQFESTMYGDALSAVDNSISGNTTLRSLDLQAKTLERTLNVQRAGWLPTLALTASYNWTSSSDGSPFKNFRWTPYSVIGLSLNVPLGEFSRIYTVKQTRLQQTELALQRENTERSVKMQVDLAVDNINTNVKQATSCAESVRQASEAHRIAKESFEIGAATYLDLRDAELALTRSRLAYNQAIYNYLVARNDLELLLGNFDLTPYQPAK